MSRMLAYSSLLLSLCLCMCLNAQQDSLVVKTDTVIVKPVLQEGIASYYAQKFNGRKTSSGERFSNDSLMAAHKTLPLGTYVRVTNLKNDSVVVVKINDRLPKSSKRSIDLSQQAARQLNFIRAGLTRVSIEVLNPKPD